MAISVTNQQAAQALRGQSVLVTLNATDSAQLANFSVGQKATVGSSSKVGYISSVDKYGHSFELTPVTPDANFDSTSTPTILNNSDTVSVG